MRWFYCPEQRQIAQIIHETLEDQDFAFAGIRIEVAVFPIERPHDAAPFDYGRDTLPIASLVERIA
jgi:hypothetical protein